MDQQNMPKDVVLPESMYVMDKLGLKAGVESSAEGVAADAPPPLEQANGGVLSPSEGEATHEPAPAKGKPHKRVKRPRKGQYRARRIREYHSRLLSQNRADLATAYRERHAWAWVWVGKGARPEDVAVSQSFAQSDSPIANDSQQVGGEGDKRGECVESGIDSHHSPNFDTKDFLANELDTKSAIRELFTEAQERRIREIVSDVVSLALKGFGGDVAREGTPEIEEARYFKEEKVPVVWPKDSGETFEVVITGAPPNKGMRLVQREGDAEVYQMWCDRGLWPMVGWRVAARPSDDSERPGLLMVGVYGRSGLRVE